LSGGVGINPLQKKRSKNYQNGETIQLEKTKDAICLAHLSSAVKKKNDGFAFTHNEIFSTKLPSSRSGALRLLN
jgi:hypothetical protein